MSYLNTLDIYTYQKIYKYIYDDMIRDLNIRFKRHHRYNLSYVTTSFRSFINAFSPTGIYANKWEPFGIEIEEDYIPNVKRLLWFIRHPTYKSNLDVIYLN